jgi:hypothetical protein
MVIYGKVGEELTQRKHWVGGEELKYNIRRSIRVRRISTIIDKIRTMERDKHKNRESKLMNGLVCCIYGKWSRTPSYFLHFLKLI